MAVTQLDVVHNFMEALAANDGLTPEQNLDAAVRVVTGNDYKASTLIDALVSECREAESAEAFLSEKCGIVLDNADVGAVTGADAGGVVKTNVSLVPETASFVSFTGTQFVTRGVLVTLCVHDDYDPAVVNSAHATAVELADLTTTEGLVWQALYTWLVPECLRLIEESLGSGYAFTSPKASCRVIHASFVPATTDDEATSDGTDDATSDDGDDDAADDNDDTPDDGETTDDEEATVKRPVVKVTVHYTTDGKAYDLDLAIDASYFEGKTDARSICDETLGDERVTFDRLLARELTRAVAAVNVTNFNGLPEYVREGAVPEAVVGADDTLPLAELAGDADALEAVLKSRSSSKDATAAGFIFVRYLAKQFSDGADVEGDSLTAVKAFRGESRSLGVDFVNASLLEAGTTLVAVGNVSDGGVGAVWSIDGGITWSRRDPEKPDGQVTSVKAVYSPEKGMIYAFGRKVNDDRSAVLVCCVGRVTGAKALEWGEWQDLGGEFPREVTDALAVDNKAYVAYTSKKTGATKGTVYVVEVALGEGAVEVAWSTSLEVKTGYDQRNAKLVEVSPQYLGVVCEQEDDAGYYQVDYAQVNVADVVEHQATAPVRVSNGTEAFHHYGTSVVKQGQDLLVAYRTPSTEDYRYTTVRVRTVNRNDGTLGKEVTVASPGPCTDVEDFYPSTLLFTDGSVLYSVSTHGKLERLRVTDAGSATAQAVADSNWLLLAGVLRGSGLYAVVSTDLNVAKLVKVPDDVGTALADDEDEEETGERGVINLRLASVSSKAVYLSWTPPSPPSSAFVQRLSSAGAWTQLATVEAGASSYVVGTRDTVNTVAEYAVVGVDSDSATTFAVIPASGVVAVVQEDGTTEVTLRWQPESGLVGQAVYCREQAWENCQRLSDPYQEYASVSLDGELTAYRVTAVADGVTWYSNPVRPLTCSLNDAGDVVLEWTNLGAAAKVTVEQSVDNEYWYKVKETSSLSTSCTVTALKNVVCRFRLKFVLAESGEVLYSNEVAAPSVIRVTGVSYSFATVQLTNVDPEESKRVLYSTDLMSWEDGGSFGRRSSCVVTGLEYFTNYWVRVEYTDRTTGRYSNTVAVKTAPKPVTDLRVVPKKDADGVYVWTFSVDDAYLTDDGTLEVFCAYEDALTNEVVERSIRDLTHEVTGELGERVVTAETPLASFRGVTFNCAIKTAGGGNRDGWGNVVTVAVPSVAERDGVQAFPDTSATAVDYHTVRLSTNKVPPASGAERTMTERVYAVQLSCDDGGSWQDWPYTVNFASGSTNFTLSNLAIGVPYRARVVCLYGEDKGTGKDVEVRTESGSFVGVAGPRLPGERSVFAVDAGSGGGVLVFDRGRIYRVTGDDVSEQAVLCELGDAATTAHVYSAFARGLDGKTAVLAYSYSKEVYLAAGTTSFSGTRVYVNEEANECLNVDAVVLPTGTVVVTWEENYGYASAVKCLRVPWADLAAGTLTVAPDQVSTLTSGGFNRFPRLLAVDNGFRVACLRDNGVRVVSVITEARLVADFGTESVTSVDYTVDAEVSGGVSVDTESPFLSFAVDNLGGLHFFFHGYVNQGSRAKGMVYARPASAYLELVTAMVDCVYPQGMMTESLVFVTQGVSGVTAYGLTKNGFTGAVDVGLEPDENPVAVDLAPDGAVTLLTVRGGLFAYKTLPGESLIPEDVTAAAESGIGDALTNNDAVQAGSARVTTYAVGDADDYPRVFFGVNAIIREITQRDAAGNPSVKSYALTELTAVDPGDSGIPEDSLGAVRYVCTLDGETVERVIDLTDWLAYKWDRTTVVNV